MKYPTIRIEGAILSPETLDKIGAADATVQGQRPLDFRLDATAKVKDEIAATWADAQDHWRIFRRKTKDLKPTDTGTSEVRKFWMVPFLSLLGYDLEPANAELVNGQSYAISHRDKGLSGFPVHLTGYQDWQHKAPEERTTLDIKPSNAARRMSPHALVQEYINLKDEHSYAIISNGLQLRLLRDSSRLTRLSFIEWSLEQMMDEEAYADFALLYRLLHASRMPATGADTAQSLIEGYHQDALEGGSRIREGLSGAVKKCIEGFANGFLQHRDNDALREALKGGGPDAAKEYFGQQLRLIYCLLFLMVTEERDLIYAKGANRSQRDIYYKYYSLQRLRRLAEKAYLRDARYTDHWAGLQQIFSLFEAPLSAHAKGRGEALGIQPLGGDLFSQGALGLLRDCTLSNKVLLECLYDLSVFRHKDTGARIRVNYASLNVEEFGSVYEGLLEYDAVVVWNEGAQPAFRLVKGSERSSSGSHYTPDELVQPLIKHSLEYLIEECLKEPDPVDALLRLKVCDVACGSGHILLSAARRIAVEVARKKWNEEQPSPAHLREATREVIKRCIYGVDKNPLAVELCKVALWLEAHNPGEPLGFLDHHIKCGDAIVGLTHRAELERGIADEAFKALPGDEKAVASAWKKKNSDERKGHAKDNRQLTTAYNEADDAAVKEYNTLYAQWLHLPERTAADVAARQHAYQQLQKHRGHGFEQTMANTQVAQFFIPKTAAQKDRLLSDGDYRQMLRGYKVLTKDELKELNQLALNRRFFHWFLEFPEVDAQGGFDCVLGNPPYLGGKKISGSFGNHYLEIIHCEFDEVGGQADLVTYFIRRIETLIKQGGYFAIVTTNSISEGDTRSGGLDYITRNQNQICFAIKSMKWPGLANLNVALVSVIKGEFKRTKVLNNYKVLAISSYLDDGQNNSSPAVLKANSAIIFRGVDFGGTGFILEKQQAMELLKTPEYKNVICQLINGEEINNEPDQSAQRYIINFYDFYEIEARQYSELYDIVREKVLPYRMEGNDKLAKEKWWLYKRSKLELYQELKTMPFCFVTAFTSKYLSFSKLTTNIIISNALNIVKSYKYFHLCLLHSNIHEEWVRKYSSSLESRLRYSSTDVFETFPFPQNLGPEQEQTLETVGERYHEHRRQLMLAIQLGLTKTYNLFHSRELRFITPAEDALEDKAFAKAFGKDAAHLHRHLRATPGTIPFNDAVQRIEDLRALHVEMDATVLAAYGWQALPLRPDFYEVDYLPEGDRSRYTIHPDARKEVLKRLLELNHKIHAEEMALAETNKLLAAKGPKKRKEPKSAPQLSLPDMGRPRTPYEWMYSLQDVVRVTGIHRDTAKRWMRVLHDRFHYEGVRRASGNTEDYWLNFYSMHELIVFADLMRNRIRLGEMLEARDWLKERFAGDVKKEEFYPYTSKPVLETIGKAGRQIIFTDPATGDQLTIGKLGNVQLNLHVLQGILKNVVYDKNMISRLYLDKAWLIAIDPVEASGRPCVLTDEGGVSIDTIKADFEVARDYSAVAKRWRTSEAAVREAIVFKHAHIFAEN